MPRIRTPYCECGHIGARHEPYVACRGLAPDDSGPTQQCPCTKYVDANPSFADAIHRDNRLRTERPPVIDANTGERLYPDTFITNVNGEFLVCWLDVGLLSGTAYIRRNTNTVIQMRRMNLPDFGEVETNRYVGRRPARLGPVERVALQVRWTHPSFFGQRVAFFPS